MNKIMKKKAIAALVLAALACLGAAHAQTLPIAQRVHVPYYIEVKERGSTVTLVLDERINDGLKIQRMRQEMTAIIRNVCSETCTDYHKKTVRRKILEEATDLNIRASEVLFK